MTVQSGELAIGEVAYDSDHDRVGVLMGYEGGRALLRPVGGGREWEVHPQALAKPDSSQQLRARVSEVNAAPRRV